MMISINQNFNNEDTYHDNIDTYNDYKYFNQTSSLSINKGRFLGATDHVIISGNLNNSASIQTFYGVDKVAEVCLNNRKSFDMELIGIARTSQTFAVLSSMSRFDRLNSIDLINLETSIHTTSMSLVDRSLFTADHHSNHVASMSYFSDYELLAVGTDSGYVILYDLFLGVEVCQFKADSCGITKVKFTKTGSLITVGLSNKNQIKIWDLKSNECLGLSQRPVMTLSQQITNQSIHRKSNHHQQQHGGSDGAGFYSFINAIAMHPLMSDKMMSGDQYGQVLLWDLRAEGSIAFQPHHKPITDLQVHPQRHDTVLTSSSDGTVRCFDMNNAKNIASSSTNTNSNNNKCDDCYTFVHTSVSGASVTSIDIDCCSSSSSSISTLLAVSDIGEIVKIHI